MAKISKVLIRIFNYMVTFFPLIMAVFLSLVYFAGGWNNLIEGHDFEYYFLKKIDVSLPLIGLIFIWIISIASLTYLFNKISIKVNTPIGRKIFLSIFIFLLAFGVRYLLIFMYREDLLPFSDFSAAWERARGDFEAGKIEQYSLFPAYMNFSLYENYIIRIFGESFVNILYINAAYCGITAIFLFLITREITDNDFACILAGVIYALYPSNIFYSLTATPEFIAILFNTIGVYAFIKAYKKKNMVYQLIWIIIGGLSLGVGGSFKTYSIVMIIAFAMVLIAKYIIENRKCNKQEILSVVLVIIIGLLGYKCASTSILNMSSQHFNMGLSTEKAVPHFLLVGLNTESEGQINVGTLSDLYRQYYMSNGLNYEEAKAYAYDLLKNDWANNKKRIIPNFGKKMIWAWQDDYTPIYYYLNRVGINIDSVSENFVYKTVDEYGAGIVQIAYFLIMLFASVAVLANAKKKDVDFVVEFLLLIVFGYFCMIFLVEGQSRYKCLVMPYVIVFSAIGLNNIYNGIKQRIQNRKKPSVYENLKKE